MTGIASFNAGRRLIREHARLEDVYEQLFYRFMISDPGPFDFPSFHNLYDQPLAKFAISVSHPATSLSGSRS